MRVSARTPALPHAPPHALRAHGPAEASGRSGRRARHEALRRKPRARRCPTPPPHRLPRAGEGPPRQPAPCRSARQRPAGRTAPQGPSSARQVAPPRPGRARQAAPHRPGRARQAAPHRPGRPHRPSSAAPPRQAAPARPGAIPSRKTSSPPAGRAGPGPLWPCVVPVASDTFQGPDCSPQAHGTRVPTPQRLSDILAAARIWHAGA
ncbi:caspase recruitment domain-containing protein 19 isoform X1 [Falco biarmicus]|uniref:caspase recruitment domain-containing protein 19 isoform X1 n=1 Tax=Falco cherrug TaxID=345164 RepID=UPI002478EF7D|nr:caspase recruitment domain-containing protein 19 isoform X1 [Falco cherrug]XP_056194551.1 caspase recruitment domain-containing protein 19 isoform X1 [Falco biarmicus]